MKEHSDRTPASKTNALRALSLSNDSHVTEGAVREDVEEEGAG